MPTKNASWGHVTTAQTLCNFLIPHMHMHRGCKITQIQANLKSIWVGGWGASQPNATQRLSTTFQLQGSRPRTALFCNFFTQLLSSAPLITFSIAIPSQSCSAACCSNVALLYCTSIRAPPPPPAAGAVYICRQARFPTAHCLL